MGTFADIPRADLKRLQVRIHKGYRKQLKQRAADEDVTIEVAMHNLLAFVFGDPEPGRRKKAKSAKSA